MVLKIRVLSILVYCYFPTNPKGKQHLQTLRHSEIIIAVVIYYRLSRLESTVFLV